MDVLKSNDTTIVYKEAIENAACAFAYHEDSVK